MFHLSNPCKSGLKPLSKRQLGISGVCRRNGHGILSSQARPRNHDCSRDHYVSQTPKCPVCDFPAFGQLPRQLRPHFRMTVHQGTTGPMAVSPEAPVARDSDASELARSAAAPFELFGRLVVLVLAVAVVAALATTFAVAAAGSAEAIALVGVTVPVVAAAAASVAAESAAAFAAAAAAEVAAGFVVFVRVVAVLVVVAQLATWPYVAPAKVGSAFA